MGKNKSILEVVSSIMTVNEKVILVDPDRTAVAPKMAITEAKE